MFKNFIKIISNPLLYYVDKEGNCVFRNYCLFNETGNLYKTSITKQNVGKALEYRFELDKKLKWTYFLTPIILYFIFIHIKFSILALLMFEILWIGLVTIARLFCSYLYREYLLIHFGKYETTEFRPPISDEKYESYVNLFYSRAVAILVLVVLYMLPSFVFSGVMKYQLSSKHNNFKQAISVANTYFMLYPKNEKIYDMRAYARYMAKDYEGALNDYKSVLEISGRKFTKEDYVRFANLLFLQKKMSSPQEAVDVFNEYVTKKKLSVLEASQMLWIKSIFKIENDITETILQEYQDLLLSLNSKDMKNKFYITSDKAYIHYLMEDYSSAIYLYDSLISYALNEQDKYSEELSSLYVERGWAKKRLGDHAGANLDFTLSKVEQSKLGKYEPSFSSQEFVLEL